jgi:glycosyltransferase involved in cell wall biosynthesis
MNIVIFGDAFSFPEGEASANRVHTYAKGFYENGSNAHVICFASKYDSADDGIINGIYYYHPFGQSKRNKYFLVRRWQKLLKYFNTLKLFKRIDRKDKINVIIVYTMLLQTHLFGWFLSRIYKSKFLIESGEHPLRLYQDGFLRKQQGLMKLKIESRSCDGILCISQFLINFYNKRGIPHHMLFLVPSTVDTERFRSSFTPPLTFQYISYCGGLTASKDGVNILIESFERISQKYQDINLVLIGKGDSIEDEMNFKDLVGNLNINKRVFFLGFLPRTKIPEYLNNAKILALARPRSMVADAGFPSKLTEYLATGVPVVVTKVGEIPIYLKDNENSFLSEPDSVEDFAEKLDFVLGNYEYAKEVAKKGKELTDTVFHYKYQAKRIIEFINSI